MNKKVRFNFSLLISTGLFLIMIAVLIGVVLIILGNFTSTYYEECCKNQSGNLVFYECQNPPPFSNETMCSDLKTGYYCNINGTEVKVEDLKCVQDIMNTETIQ
jgi:hypothetical protein